MRSVTALTNMAGVAIDHCVHSPGGITGRANRHVTGVVRRVGCVPGHTPNVLLGTRDCALNVLVPSFRGRLFTSVLTKVRSIASRRGCRALVTGCGCSHSSRRRSIVGLLSCGVSKVVLSRGCRAVEAIGFLHSTAVPIIRLVSMRKRQLSVRINFSGQRTTFSVIYAVLRGQIERGVLCLNSGSSAHSRRHCRKCYSTVVLRGLSPLHVGPHTVSSVRLKVRLVHSTLDTGPSLSNMFYAGSSVTVNTLLLYHRQGLTIPRRVSVTNFRKLRVNERVVPDLTDMVAPHFSVNQVTTRVLLDGVGGGSRGRGAISLKCRVCRNGAL